MTLLDYLVFALGSGFGGMARYLMSSDPVLGVLHDGIPLATMVVNALGAFIAGFTVSLSLQAMPQVIRSFMVGFAGGMTTYSAFALESVQIFYRGGMEATSIYLFVSILLYIIAAAIGFLVADYIEGPW